MPAEEIYLVTRKTVQLNALISRCNLHPKTSILSNEIHSLHAICLGLQRKHLATTRAELTSPPHELSSAKLLSDLLGGCEAP